MELTPRQIVNELDKYIMVRPKPKRWLRWRCATDTDAAG